LTEESGSKAGEASVGRRMFLMDSARAAVGLGFLSAGVKVWTQKGPALAVHNMLIVGKTTTFLYHLPLFSFPGFVSPRRYQMILDVTFSGKNLQDYTEDRRKSPDKQIYTFGPERFSFSSAKDLPTSLKGTIFRGHLEKKGGVPICKDVIARIARVNYFQELDPNNAKDRYKLEYFIFGRGQELFIAHLLSKPPDFDQILSVEDTNKQLTGYGLNYLDYDTRKDGTPTPPTLLITFPQRNVLTERLKPKKTIEGTSTKIYRSYVKESVKISVGTEYYFEEGELRAPPEYATTHAERAAGFP
jgi:hypothetical protein